MIGRLRVGDLPVIEPGLVELIAGNGARQSFVADAAALHGCRFGLYRAGRADERYRRQRLDRHNGLIRTVIPQLGPRAVLVVLCQVPPGFTRGLPIPPGGLFYQVETLIFGRAVERGQSARALHHRLRRSRGCVAGKPCARCSPLSLARSCDAL